MGKRNHPILSANNFNNLIITPANNNTSSTPQLMSQSYSDTTDEDYDDLYPEYLQEILNEDTIVQMGKFFFKIDLVNDKALVIDSSKSQAYNRLKNNYPNTQDSDIMLFDEDEDVLDVLDWIENNNGSYVDYLEQKIGLQVPIFCFDHGARRQKDKRYNFYDNTTNNRRYKTELTYQKAIIYFRMHAEGKAQKKFLILWVSDASTSLTLNYSDRWVQRCRKLSQPGETGSKSYVSGPDINYVAYSGAKGLRQYEMECQFIIQRVDWAFYQFYTVSPNHYIMSGY